MRGVTTPNQIIDNLPIAVVEIDAKHCILQMNAVARQIFSFAQNELFEFDSLAPQLEHSTDSLVAFIDTAIRRKQPVHDLTVALTLPNCIHVDWFQLNAEPLFQEGRISMVLSFVNINRRKFQERIVREQQAQLLESARLIDVNVLAGGIAHEINNPLAILKGYTEIMRNKISDGCEVADIEKDLYWIEKNITRISNIVNTVRQFSEKSQNPEFESRTLKSIIDSALIFCKERILKNQIAVHLQDIPETITINCKWAKLTQALYNILLNAFDALEDCGTPEKWISISFRDQRHYFEVDIADNGSGVAPDIAEQILLPFYTTKPPGRGMGLGLTVARDYLAGHNGYLKLQRELPHTVFTIGLPKPLVHAATA